MDHTDYPFEVDEWLRTVHQKVQERSDFIGDRPYRHFDGRVTYQALYANTSGLVPFLKYPDRLVRHSFMPFLRKDKKLRRYTWNRATKAVAIGQKLRPIMYACHRDACICLLFLSPKAGI
jgi:hypothetical protein